MYKKKKIVTINRKKIYTYNYNLFRFNRIHLLLIIIMEHLMLQMRIVKNLLVYM